MKPANWCPYPFHYAMTTPDLVVRPCCRYDSSAALNELSVDSFEQIERVFNGPIFSQLRTAFLKNEQPTGCTACFSEEERSIPSLRQKAIFERTLSTSSSPFIESMEIGVGRLCNLKCRTCNSQYSSKWDSDEVKLGLPSNYHHRPLEADLDNFPESLFSNLKELKITGGEPFLNKSFEFFLKRFCQSGFAASCDLEIFSNCSIIPNERILSSLADFKSVRISASVDGLEERNDYIRHPSRWKIVEKNLSFWKDWARQRSNRSLWVACTICLYNVIDSFDILSWCDSFFESDAKVVFQILHGPSYLSVMTAPPKLKSLVAKHLADQLNTTHQHLKSNRHTKNIDKVFNILSQSGHVVPLQNFLIETEKIDKLRGENFNNIFPLLANWVNQCLD